MELSTFDRHRISYGLQDSPGMHDKWNTCTVDIHILPKYTTKARRHMYMYSC